MEKTREEWSRWPSTFCLEVRYMKTAFYLVVLFVFLVAVSVPLRRSDVAAVWNNISRGAVHGPPRPQPHQRLAGTSVNDTQEMEIMRLLRDLSSEAYDDDYLRSFRSPYIRETPQRHSGSSENLTLDSQGRIAVKHVAWSAVPSFIHRSSDRDLFGHCPVNNCHISYNLHLRDADAVIFTQASMAKPVPHRATDNQVYIFYRMESPANSATNFKHKDWNKVINWTMHYRIDSDVFLPVGTLKRAGGVPPLSYFVTLAEQKLKDAAWFVSNCKTSSKRSSYVRAMQTNLTVDVYGRCGQLKCPDGPACLSMLTSRYRYYLSFENSFCRDYVTEKLFKTFRTDVHVVPVVRGGADYARFFPRGTFVDAGWFDGPLRLVQFLKALGRDTKTYAKMLWRKAHFEYHEHGMADAWCQICDKLHHLDRTDVPGSSWHLDLYRWFADGVCTAPPSF